MNVKNKMQASSAIRSMRPQETHVKLTGEFRQASLMRTQTSKIRMYAAGTVTANYVCFSLAAWLLYTFRRALCAWLKREHYCAPRGTL